MARKHYPPMEFRRIDLSKVRLPERGPLSPDKRFGEEVCHERFLRGEHWAYHCKCGPCTVEFSVRSWWPDLNPENWRCPLCRGRISIVTQEHVKKFIFEVMQGQTIYVDHDAPST